MLTYFNRKISFHFPLQSILSVILERQLFSCLYTFHVCMHSCVISICKGVCFHVCTCVMWMPEISTECLPILFPTLFCKRQGLSLNMWLTDLVRPLASRSSSLYLFITRIEVCGSKRNF